MVDTVGMKAPATQADWTDTMAASAQADEQAKRDANPPPRAFKQRLMVKLTEHEMAQAAAEIGTKTREKQDLEGKKKQAKDHWEARIDGTQARIDELAERCATGEEEREVECVEERFFETGVVRVTRSDTKAVLSERAMQSHERQPTLPKVSLDLPAISPVTEEPVEVTQDLQAGPDEEPILPDWITAPEDPGPGPHDVDASAMPSEVIEPEASEDTKPGRRKKK